jgi:hypothetical protein
VSERWRGRVGMGGKAVWRIAHRRDAVFTWKQSTWRVLAMCPFVDLPSFWYSSMVFFSPTLKPSVCSGTRSSWTAASLDMMAGDQI